MHRLLRAALTAAVLLGVSQQAAAQARAWEDRVFAGVSFGLEAGTEEVSQSRSFPVYGEQATLLNNSSFDRNNILDLTLGARVWRNLGVALAYHTGTASGSGDVSGSVPHPLFFDRPRNFSERLSGFERKEHATHLQIGWMVPISDNVDVFVYGGPSFFRISQDIVSDISVGEQGFPYANVVVSPTLAVAKRNATGYNVGVDASYMFYNTDAVRLGVGGFLRVTGASATLRAGDSVIDTDLGGVQFGLGARIRF